MYTKKSITLFFVLIIGISIYAQNLNITVDGTNLQSKDSISLISYDPLLGTPVYNFLVSVNPGKKTFSSYPVDDVRLFQLNYKFYFLVGRNDSVNISYTRGSATPIISGGRYKENHKIYQQISLLAFPVGKYKQVIDNYEDYIRGIDSVSFARRNIIETSFKESLISNDVYEYMSEFIKYSHISASILANSPCLKKLFPKTGSAFYSPLKLDDFLKDQYSEMMMYIFSANKYFRFLANIGTDNVNVTTNTIRYVVNNLKGDTKDRLIYSLIVNNQFGSDLADKREFKKLYPEINSVNIPEIYMVDINKQFSESLIQGEAIDSVVLSTSFISALSGASQSFKSFLKKNEGKKVLIAFWASWCQPCIENLPKLRTLIERQSDTTVFYISMDKNLGKWKEASKKYSIEKSQFLLEKNFESPLAKYFLISGIPKYILINEKGVVEKADIILY